MKLNIELRNNIIERLQYDAQEVWPDCECKVTELVKDKIAVLEVSSKEERVFSIEVLCELQSWYGYGIRIY